MGLFINNIVKLKLVFVMFDPLFLDYFLSRHSGLQVQTTLVGTFNPEKIRQLVEKNDKLNLQHQEARQEINDVCMTLLKGIRSRSG
jgi:hypothetical protein